MVPLAPEKDSRALPSTVPIGGLLSTIAWPAVLEVTNELGSLINYGVAQSTTANGSSKDWAYGTIGATAFTVETATEFIPTGAEMEQIVQEILLGSVWVAARACLWLGTLPTFREWMGGLCILSGCALMIWFRTNSLLTARNPRPPK